MFRYKLNVVDDLTLDHIRRLRDEIDAYCAALTTLLGSLPSGPFHRFLDDIRDDLRSLKGKIDETIRATPIALDTPIRIEIHLVDLGLLLSAELAAGRIARLKKESP